MTLRSTFAGGALAAGLLLSSASQAATLTTDFATWAAAVGVYATTTSTGADLYNTITAVPLSDGMTVQLANADTVLQPFSGWGPWSGTYAGDIIDTVGQSETISFSSSLSALGFEISPDFGLVGSNAEIITVTLSDGTTTQISGNFPAGTTQFVGFYGGGVTSMTVSVANATDFAFGNIVDVPEPLSMSLLATGLVGLGWVRRRGQA